MGDSEPLLRSLGVTLRPAFDWGDEPQIKPTPKPIIPGSHASADELPSSQTQPASSAAALAVVAPSGLDSLKKFVQTKASDNPNETKVKNVIQSLLQDANISLSPTLSAAFSAGNTTEEADAQHAFEKQNAKHKKRHQKLLLLKGDTNERLRDVPIQGLSDRAVAQLTVESKTSLFGSILRIFDMDRSGALDDIQLGKPPMDGDDSTSSIDGADSMIMKAPILTTPEIVRTVHLTTRPGDIPPGMDSKEYTLAALHFLSTHVPLISENDYGQKQNDSSSTKSSKEGWDFLRQNLPILPLLKAIDPEECIEKRSYGRVRPLVELGSTQRKALPDSMDKDMEFRRKVLNLERIFASSLPYSATPSKAATEIEDTTKRDANDIPHAFQNYVPRRKLCPHVDGAVKEELTLMISGHFQQQYQPRSTGLSSKASNASLTSTEVASKSSSPKSKPAAGDGGGDGTKLKPANKPTPHLKIKLGVGSKSNAEKKDGNKSPKQSATPPKRKAEEEDKPHPKVHIHLSKKKKFIDDTEEFGF